MGTLYIQAETLENIADAIREKSGTSEVMSPSQMVSKIGEIQNGSNIPPIAYMSSTISEFSSNAVYVLEYAFSECLNLTSIDMPNTNYIGNGAFYFCKALQSINLPNVSCIGEKAFQYCSSLQSVNLPNVTYIGENAFQHCKALQSIDLSNVSYINGYAFFGCSSITLVNLPTARYIGFSAFRNCYKLLSLYLLSTSICSLASTNVFLSTPISDYTAYTEGVYGSIYVPASLLTTYKAATNWSAYSSRFVGV